MKKDPTIEEIEPFPLDSLPAEKRDQEPKIESTKKDVASRIEAEWSMTLEDFLRVSAENIAQHVKQVKEFEEREDGIRHPERAKVLKEIDELRQVLEDLKSELEK